MNKVAIISCPECNGKVSDKATSCPHCGFPLQQNDVYSLYNVIYKGLPNTRNKNKDQMKVVGQFQNLKSMGFSDALNIINNPPQTLFYRLTKENAEWIKKSFIQLGCIIELEECDKCAKQSSLNDQISVLASNGSTVLCPRCGSNEIVTGQRGYSLLTGFIGSSKTVNRCSKCGYKWEP